MPDFTHFVGIDVAMKTLDVHFHPSGKAFAVPNTAAGVKKLLRRLKPGTAIALEASGGYERRAAEGLAREGWPVYRLHPADVRAFAHLRGKRAKTDRIDAELIAHVAQVAAASRKPYRANPLAADLKEMAACRRILINQRTNLKGQATRLETKSMRRVIAHQIDTIDTDIKKIESHMAGIVERDESFRDKARRIQTAPGAGPILATTLIACLPELGELSSRQAASLVGVAPHPRQSGANAMRGRCQAGRTNVRSVLYMAALSAIRSKASPLRPFYERLRANGKPFKLAIVAVMRKLIVIINTMIKNEQDWKYQPR